VFATLEFSAWLRSRLSFNRPFAFVLNARRIRGPASIGRHPPSSWSLLLNFRLVWRRGFSFSSSDRHSPKPSAPLDPAISAFHPAA